MMLRVLRSVGIKSGVSHMAGLLSIVASIAAWFAAKSSADRPSAERLGIFVALGGPTFMLIGKALQALEEKEPAGRSR